MTRTCDLSRDLAEMGNRMNLQRPIMGREEFEAKKAEMKRKRESERQSEGYSTVHSLLSGLCILQHVNLLFVYVWYRGNVYRDGEKNRMMNNNSAASSSPMKPKTVCVILMSQFSLPLSLGQLVWLARDHLFNTIFLSFISIFLALCIYHLVKKNGLIPQLLNRRSVYI